MQITTEPVGPENLSLSEPVAPNTECYVFVRATPHEYAMMQRLMPKNGFEIEGHYDAHTHEINGVCLVHKSARSRFRDIVSSLYDVEHHFKAKRLEIEVEELKAERDASKAHPKKPSTKH